MDIHKIIDADTCIIGDGPDHILLAVRVPKALISENIMLFAAMADAATNITPPPHSDAR